MTESLLAEDSSNYNLVPRVRRIAQVLKDEVNQHRCLVCLLDLLMFESQYCAVRSFNDFTPVTPLWQVSANSEAVPQQYCPREDGIYQITYQIIGTTDGVCKLIAVPTGDILLVNLVPTFDGVKSRVIALYTLKYVNCSSTEIDGRFFNLKELSHRVKDCLTTPIKCEYLTNAGIMNPSLVGLPKEIQLYIMKFLSKKDLRKFALCSKSFFELYFA